MKERWGNAVLTSVQRDSVWRGLEDRGWTEETSLTAAASVSCVKNMSRAGPLLESSERLSVSEGRKQNQSRLHQRPTHRKKQSPSVFHLCCCHPHYPGSLVLCAEGWTGSCSFRTKFHQRCLHPSLRLQQHLLDSRQARRHSDMCHSHGCSSTATRSFLMTLTFPLRRQSCS